MMTIDDDFEKEKQSWPHFHVPIFIFIGWHHTLDTVFKGNTIKLYAP